ncbi:MAG: right-handed parallel beta-helix repeat-containing protein [Methanobacteriota archaeon]
MRSKSFQNFYIYFLVVMLFFSNIVTVVGFTPQGSAHNTLELSDYSSMFHDPTWFQPPQKTEIDEELNRNIRSEGPNISIDYAGNLSDDGGPYWRPPGEIDRLDEPGEGVWRNGYYANDSEQHEEWIYIHATVADADGVDAVLLHWFDRMTGVWENDSYQLQYVDGDSWEINTSDLILDIQSGHEYSFDLWAVDGLGNSNVSCWMKTGLGGGLTRRFVHLGCIPQDVTYRPLYLRSYTNESGRYDWQDRSCKDRFHHDQGPDGTRTDSGYLVMTPPGQDVEDRYCFTYTGYWFDENVCSTSFTLTNVYFHFWYASRKDNLTYAGWTKSRDTLDVDPTDIYDPPGKELSRSHVVYDHNNRECYLETHLLQTVPTSFTDNSIYEFCVKFLENPLLREDHTPTIKTLSNRSILSFVLLNVPENSTLVGLDSDGDQIDDWTELYVTYTNPFLSDTDDDGANDYEEVNGAAFGSWDSDPNSYTDTTDFRVALDVEAGGPYYGFIDSSIHFFGNAFGGEPGYAWFWEFGSGESSTEQNPVMTFSEFGVFSVRLVVHDQGGNVSEDKTTVTIQHPVVWVDGSFTPDTPGWGVTCFARIQDAIDHGPVGGQVVVRPGTYYEHVFVDKPLTLRAEQVGSTIIDGSYNGDVVTMIADGATLSGFILQHSGNVRFMYFEAINILADHTVITHNRIQGCGLGISFAMDCCYNRVSENVIVDTMDAVGLGGTYIEGPSWNTVSSNTLVDNYAGIYLANYASHNVISKNTITNTTNNIYGLTEVGIALFGSSNNIVSGNTVTQYFGGMGTEYSSSWSIPSNGNSFFHNNLVNNTFSGFDPCSNLWYDPVLEQGNYWTDYNGSDSDHDGIGDTPYTIYGVGNQDLFPLMNRWPSYDVAVVDFRISSSPQSTPSTHQLVLTASLKNSGTGDVMVPFVVSFYGIGSPVSHSESSVLLGSVWIDALAVHEVVSVQVSWSGGTRFRAVSVFADSTNVIAEVNETNNKMILKIR